MTSSHISGYLEQKRRRRAMIIRGMLLMLAAWVPLGFSIWLNHHTNKILAAAKTTGAVPQFTAITGSGVVVQDPTAFYADFQAPASKQWQDGLDIAVKEWSKALGRQVKRPSLSESSKYHCNNSYGSIACSDGTGYHITVGKDSISQRTEVSLRRGL